MDRNEQRVELGVGAFHNPPRVQYSEETKNVIKQLMEESNLSMMYRKSVQSAIDKGESLPNLSRSPSATYTNNINTQIAECKSGLWKKRSQDAIIKSGAYEREQYIRTEPLRNKEKEKNHLANMMCYGKDMPVTPHGPKILHKERKVSTSDDDILDNLAQGIRERIEFINEMDHLGVGEKYRSSMYQEIAENMRIIKSMDKRKSSEIEREFMGLKYERSSPKPFPMGELDQI